MLEPRLAPNPADLFSDLLRAMVDGPSALEINAVSEPDDVVIRVRAAKEDIGNVIGMGGRTAKALWALLLVVSNASSRHLVLKPTGRAAPRKLELLWQPETLSGDGLS